MRKSTKLIAGSALAGIVGVLAYRRYKEYQQKYPLLDELKAPFHFTFPEKSICPWFADKMNKVTTAEVVELENVVTTTRKIPSYDGEDILINIIEPKEYDGKENLPCLVYSHGGGYVFGVTRQYFGLMADYANKVGCKIVLAHYRTIYEGSFDTCLEDSYSALKWTYDNAERLHIDRNRIAIGGDSAGGGITASLTHMVRDRGELSVCFQMLIYPVTDSSMSTSSMKKYTDAPSWNAKANSKMWKEVRTRMSKDIEKYASPLHCKDFSGLCNAYVEVKEFDCLHDEGVLYAERLIENGYEVELNDMKGTYHGFDALRNKAISRSIIETRAAVLRKAFRL